MKENKDFTIISIHDADESELASFRDEFRKMINLDLNTPILTNAKMKLFKVKKGELFEVVSSLEKICDVQMKNYKK